MFQKKIARREHIPTPEKHLLSEPLIEIVEVSSAEDPDIRIKLLHRR
jgi:hypothetical protein